ncbi:hypothetical protein FRC04_008512 [Tulasnella sp. 424]|nr:hypothetical protein FRC04_008512 [Tulasnella sp. 424]
MDRPSSTQADGLAFSVEPPTDNPKDHHQRLSAKRKKALVSLLNEIANLKEEDLDVEPTPATLNERIKDFTVMADDRLQNEGAALFHQFEKRAHQVDEQLLNFGNAVRPLGSSVGLISSSYTLRVRLQQILHLFRENASEAFPNKIQKEPVAPPKPAFFQRTKLRDPTHQQPLARITSDLEEIPHQFELLARDLINFLHFLHDIPEFTDEGLNSNALNFEADLKYWASCLKEFEGQFSCIAIKRYVNDLTREMDAHLEAIRDSLISFVKEGVPMIKIAQVDAQNGLLILSTVATFFSGIAATTIQYIINEVNTQLQQVVVALWVTSIIFGVGSAVNSQLSYQWRAAAYRSPRSAVPAFTAGLLCYAYSSFQGNLVATCATVFTALTSLAPLSLAVWFGVERLVFAKTGGSKRPQEIMGEWRERFLHGIGWIWVVKASSAGFRIVAKKSTEILARLPRHLAPRARRESISTESDAYDMEEYSAGLPTPNTSPKAERVRRFSGVSGPEPIRVPSPPSLPQVSEIREIPSPPVRERAPWSRPGQDPAPPQDNSQDPPPPPTSPTPRMGLKDAVRRVIYLERMKSDSSQNSPPPPTSPTPKMRFQDAVKKVTNLERIKPKPKSPTNIGPGSHARRTFLSSSDGYTDPNERYVLRTTRLAGLIPKLKTLKPTQELIEHGGLVRHLQFSPDGEWLATCSWDRTVIIWKVEATLTLHQVLAHPGAGLLSQVAWSPDGKYLLTRTFRHVKIWVAETGVLKQTIPFKSKIEAVTWMPTGDSFTCVEGSVVHIMDLQGKIKADHSFERLDIHDVAFTHDEQRMLLVATLQSSRENLKPSKSKAEKRIIVYHLENKKVECQVPVLENVCSVTISSDTSKDYLALISYKDTAPPELWRISVVNIEDFQEAELQLLQTYLPSASVGLAGPSYLGQVRKYNLAARDRS